MANYKDLTLRQFLELLDLDNQLVDVEIFDYLKSKTDGFKLPLAQSVYTDIEMYYFLEVRDRINEESRVEYIKNGWEIPERQITMNTKTATILDYDKMVNRTHPWDGIAIRNAMNLLEHIIAENNSHNSETEPEYIDYSGSKGPEKFVMLHELGILEYLEKRIPVQISERKFASLLSSFTGIDKENLRTMINGTKNNNHNNKLTKENINSTHGKLTSLGLKPEYFKKKNE